MTSPLASGSARPTRARFERRHSPKPAPSTPLEPGVRTAAGTRRDRGRAYVRSTRMGARMGLRMGVLVGLLLAATFALPSGAAEAAKAASPAFRASMKRFLVAQNIPAQLGEQMSYSAAEQVLAPLVASGVAVTESMQALVLDEARKDFGKHYGDVEFLTNLYSEIYVQHFSEQEMKELADFWESPVARKLLGKSQAINEGFVSKLQETTVDQIGAFRTRVETQMREAGLLSGSPPQN